MNQFLQPLFFLSLLLSVILSWFVLFSGNSSTMAFYVGAFALVLGFFYIFLQFTKEWKTFDKTSRWAFAISIIGFLFLLALYNPGLFCYDTFNVIHSVSEGHFSSWHSMSYSLLVGSARILSSNVITLSLLQIFLLHLIFCEARKLTKKFPEKSLALFPFVWLGLFCLPFANFLIIFFSRDVIFSLLMTYSFFYLANIILQKKNLNKLEIFGLVLLLFFICELRQDARLIPIFVCLVLYAGRFIPKKAALLSLLGVYFGIAVTTFTFQKGGENPFSTQYKLTSIANPLNEIIYKHYQNINDVDRNALDQVIEYQAFTERHDPYEINLIHEGHYRKEVSDQAWRDFVRTYLKLLSEYTDTFLQNRIHLILTSFNLQPDSYYFEDGFSRFDSNVYYQKMAEEHSLVRIPFLTEVRKFYSEIYQSRNILWHSPLILTLVLIMLLYRFYQKKDFWWIALFLAFSSRLPIVFLMSPAAQFKYYYSFTLMVLALSVVFISRFLSRFKVFKNL